VPPPPPPLIPIRELAVVGSDDDECDGVGSEPLVVDARKDVVGGGVGAISVFVEGCALCRFDAPGNNSSSSALSSGEWPDEEWASSRFGIGANMDMMW
jgi:hypothetical protein